MPFDVADYVDFYSSAHHAKNVSEIFGADPARTYLPNTGVTCRSPITAAQAPSL